ncbi:MAG: WecB/TagA/CpsF family glycosyltransferase [Dehalococcoidia bacterium]|nr:WecB/TagA/CpsF family glycosyltransferase [Dehalococcoidia bacterium]
MGNQNFKQVNILGVEIDDISMEEAVGMVEGWIEEGGRHYIVTPNPEFVMAAQKDPEFKRILNNADLAIPDGVGLKIGSDLENTIAGVDFLERLCKEAAEKGFTTGFLGGRDGVAKEAAECLQKKYPGLKVVLAEDGGEINDNGEIVPAGPAARQPHAFPTALTSAGPPHGAPRLASPAPPPTDILFVAFGQVKQEKWIAKNLSKIPVRVAMGVGGAFDEISGRVPRVPAWVQRTGLKWLARLVLQPWRIKRQLVLVKFVWLVIVGRLGS